MIGQTWSTFMDTRADPEELDFEGLNSQVTVRQPLIRWSKEVHAGQVLDVGLEEPRPSVTGGEGVSRAPDVITRFSWNRPAGHFQTAALLRSLRAQEDADPTNERSEYGWGLSLSGRRQLGAEGSRDNLVFQLNGGEGVGRYLTDLDSVGGQDAVFDPETGELRVLEAIGGYLAYQHWWRPNAERRLFRNPRSTFVYGLVDVNNLDIQPGDAYDRTQRITLNVVVSPIAAIDVGLEALWGERRNKNDSKGRALQLQLVGTFRF